GQAESHDGERNRDDELIEPSQDATQPRPLLVDVEIVRVFNFARIPDQQPFLTKERKPLTGLRANVIPRFLQPIVGHFSRSQTSPQSSFREALGVHALELWLAAHVSDGYIGSVGHRIIANKKIRA